MGEIGATIKVKAVTTVIDLDDVGEVRKRSEKILTGERRSARL